MRLQQRGFALIAAIILVVLLAALSAFVASMVSGQSANQQLERMSRQTDLAARAGLEWGAYQVLQVPPPPAAAPVCFSTTTLILPGSLSMISVTVSCFTPASTIYQITATANVGAAPTNPNYVERQKSAVYFRP